MKPVPSLVLGLLAPVLLAAKPSSVIPERREFPVAETAKPCADFYEHACSKVNASFKLREDRSKHTFSFNDSSERLLVAKQKWLEGLLANSKAKAKAKKSSPLPSERAQELRDVYQACMRPEAAKKEERAIVKALATEVSEAKTAEAFRELIGKKLISEDTSVFQFGPIPNPDEPTSYDLYLVASLQTLPERSFYDNKDVLGDLESVVTAFFQELDPKGGKAKARTRAQAVVAFEKEFAQSFPLPVDFRERINAKRDMSKKELTERYPRLGLTSLLDRIPEKTRIRDLTPENFAWLDATLADAKVPTLQDVYLWHALSDYMDDAYPAFFKKSFDFSHKHMGGPAKRATRSERCTKLVMGSFTKEIDAELVDELFPNFPTERFVALAEKVRASIVAGVEANTWLTPEARAAAAAKMRTAKLQLVKPMTEEEWDFNPKADYSPDAPNGNMRLLRMKLLEKAIADLSKPRNRDEWGMGPLTVNAYYSPPDNKFVMPIGILQYPFFDPQASDEVNLGAVGAVIGHELGHGIDDKGARYDEGGRLKSWMSEGDLGEFQKRGARLVAQFKAAAHNGELTLGENIGDLVGLTFAYRAAFPEGKGTPEMKRSFFLQYARAWCGVIRPKFREMLLKTDSHAMGDARVNEQMKHQPGFAAAFACKPGDRMTLPETERVVIW